MNAESGFQTECMVTGTLSFILAVSRVFGIAPLYFERVPGGCRIFVSQKCSVYGKVMVIILSSFSTIALITDLTVDTETSLRAKTNANSLVWSTDVVVVNMTVVAAAFTGENRMHQMIDCIAQLSIINKELNRQYVLTYRSERHKFIMVIFSLVFGVVVIFVDYGLFMCNVIEINGKVITSSFYMFYNISYVALTLFIIQSSLIAMSVLTNLQQLNNCLKNLLREIYNDRIKQPPVTLHRLALLYCSLCNIVRQLDDSNGLPLVLLHLSFLLHLISTPYHLFIETTRSEPHNLYILLTMAWTAYHLGKIVMIIEPCHRTHAQLDVTKSLVDQMRRYTPPTSFAVISELKLFERHLILNKVTYSPMQIFTMDRTLLIAILGSITTYLVVVIQL